MNESECATAALNWNWVDFLISESVIMTRHFQRSVGDFEIGVGSCRELVGSCRELILNILRSREKGRTETALIQNSLNIIGK